jgi:membrane fusion protein (multidrug efflux system)
MTAAVSRTRSKLFFIIGIALVIVAGAALVARAYFSGKESTDDAQVDGHINPINPKIGGIVQSVNVIDNQEVKAGTVLVQIDTRDYQIALARAQADLADAQASYQAARAGLPVVSAETGSRVTSSQASMMRAQAGVESAQKELDAARARLSLAKARTAEALANYEKAARDLDRMKRLISKEEISQQQYDATITAAEAARATVDSAQAAVQEAEGGAAAADARVNQARAAFGQAEADVQAASSGPQQVESSRAQVQAAAARIEQAKAAVDQAQLNLEYATIRAPVSGIVSRKNVEVGQVIQAGQPLMALVPLEDIWVTANFKETQLDRMRPGQPAEISVDAYDGATFTGRVESIAAATGARFSLLPPENATGNFVKVVQRIPVRITLEHDADPQHVLRPGMSVVATVDTKYKDRNGHKEAQNPQGER